MQKRKVIGVLALQGAFREHIEALQRLGANTVELRNKTDLTAQLDAVVLPGGESTAMRRLLDMLGMFEDLRARIQGGLPVYGTCAGMILLAKEIEGQAFPHFATMDITVRRNAFGRQLGSFTTRDAFGDKTCEMTFIRGPVVTRTGAGVEVLSRLPNGFITACRQKNMLATAFHPELGKELTVHKYFLEMI